MKNSSQRVGVLMVLGLAASVAAGETRPVKSGDPLQAEIAEAGLPPMTFSRAGDRRFAEVAKALSEEKRKRLVKVLGELQEAAPQNPKLTEWTLLRWELMETLPEGEDGPSQIGMETYMAISGSRGDAFRPAGKWRMAINNIRGFEKKPASEVTGGYWAGTITAVSDLATEYPGNERAAALFRRVVELAQGEREEVEKAFLEQCGKSVAAKQYLAWKEIGSPLELEFVDGLTGTAVKTKELGKPVVLYFWSPSKGEAGLAEMNELSKKYEDKIAFVGVADGDGKAVCEKVGVRWPQWWGDETKGWMEKRGIETPGLYAIGADGVLMKTELQGKVERLMSRLARGD